MFEYLMPLLWMHSYSSTLLDESVFSAVLCQQKYAKRKGIPWGISEAAFNERDREGIYQYRAFGLPGLAMDPNIPKDAVIAPYASFLALLVDVNSATHNLKRMQEEGWFGRFGFYESADYSPGRASADTRYELVRCWMAHHQGMSLLAVCNLFTNSSLQRWFHQEPQVMATELLLHEKVPTAAPDINNSEIQSEPSSLRPSKRALLRSAAFDRSRKSGQAAPATGDAPLEPGLTLPLTGEEATPPQG